MGFVPPALLAMALVTVALGGCLADLPEPPPPPPAPAAIPDALADGPRTVERLLYDFGRTVVRDATGHVYPVPLRGSMHVPDGPGPFPLAVLLHGMHQTCRMAASLPLACPEAPVVAEPIENYAGYDYLGERLASHGYVVVSADANEVVRRSNDGFPLVFVGGPWDGGAAARAQLIAATVFALANATASPAAAPVGDRLVGRLDLERVGLMGHSRGGEGVVHAAALLQGHRSGAVPRAVLAFAPTDFVDADPPAGVAYAVLLPQCDGDVVTLEGASVFRRVAAGPREAPAVQLFAAGANHNWYNTVWDADDAGFRSSTRHDPACGAEGGRHGFGYARLTFEAQQEQAVAVTRAFFGWTVEGDAAFADAMRSGAALAAATCGAQVACPVAPTLAYRAPDPDQRLLLEPHHDRGLAAAEGLQVETSGFAVEEVCGWPCAGAGWFWDGASRLRLSWDGPAEFRMILAGPARDLRAMDALAVEAAQDPTDARNPYGIPQRLAVVVEDLQGRTARVEVGGNGSALAFPLGVSRSWTLLGDLTVPLASVSGLDLGAVTSITLAVEGRGALHLGRIRLQDGPLAQPDRPEGAAVPWRRGPTACSTQGAGAAGSPVVGVCFLEAFGGPDLRRYAGVRLSVNWSEAVTVGEVIRIDLGSDTCSPAGPLRRCSLASASGAVAPVLLEVDRALLEAHGEANLRVSLYPESGVAQFLADLEFSRLPVGEAP